MLHLPLFHRLFQVIVRIDDCLALLNLVSRGVGDVSVTLTVIADLLFFTHAREL